MQPLVFWPRAGAFDTGTICVLSAQPLWRELYDMNKYKKNTKMVSLDAASGLLATANAIGAGAVIVLSAQPLWRELYDTKNFLKNGTTRTSLCCLISAAFRRCSDLGSILSLLISSTHFFEAPGPGSALGT